jgi:hypothetical protein
MPAGAHALGKIHVARRSGFGRELPFLPIVNTPGRHFFLRPRAYRVLCRR